MDKIWDRKSFKVGGHWPLWRGWKKTNDHAEPTKSRKLEKTQKTHTLNIVFSVLILTTLFFVIGRAFC